MSSILDYTPSGDLTASQTNTWIVRTKQAYPIQGPLFDLAGHKFKIVLKRLNPKGPLDLEVELVTPVGNQIPLQVQFAVETSNPPGEQPSVHSHQRRAASLSDRSRIVEVNNVMMANTWEESTALRVDIMFVPIKPSQPLLARLWNSQSSKDVEIHFLDSQYAPILVHKDIVLDAAPKFQQLVQVSFPSGDGDGDGAFSTASAGLGPSTTSPASSMRSSGTRTPTSTPIPAHRQRHVLEADLLSLGINYSGISNSSSMAESFVNVGSPSFSPRDTFFDESDRGQEFGNHQDFLPDEPVDDERQRLLDHELGNGGYHQQPMHGNNGQAMDNQQTGDKVLNRKERKRLAREQRSLESGTSSPSNPKQISGDQDSTRELELMQRPQEQRQSSQQQQHREKMSPTPVIKTPAGSRPGSICDESIAPSPQPQQQQQSQPVSGFGPRPEREIWVWNSPIHPEACNLILRWIYLQELPTTPSGIFPFADSEALLQLFYSLDLHLLFQGFAQSQIRLLDQHPNPALFWNSDELAQQGMVNRYFRPILVKTTSGNLPSVLRSSELAKIFSAIDPSGILLEALANQTLTRQ
ncbi:hypothetical protein BGX29_000013 [Mortierella sp. GBA35]|nr:hypothetical protein BGX29_000013 [Mortierella sp. GBA35]